MKKTLTKKPEPIFTKLPKLMQADREVITAAIGNDKYCQRWLDTEPAEHLVKHALEIATGRTAGSGSYVETRLTARLNKIAREQLQARILAKKKSL